MHHYIASQVTFVKGYIYSFATCVKYVFKFLQITNPLMLKSHYSGFVIRGHYKNYHSLGDFSVTKVSYSKRFNFVKQAPYKIFQHGYFSILNLYKITN